VLCYRPAVGRPARVGRLAAASAIAAALGAGAPPPAPAPPAARDAAAASAAARPPVGFTVHWDFFSTAAEADRLVAFALANGATVLNVVPPPHIWEHPADLAVLRSIFAAARRGGALVALNRIDGSALAPTPESRTNWLYTHVLTERGRLPSGGPTPDYFLATVGNPAYERWLREETAYYAENFSAEPSLLAFGVGLFNEPFVSQRGSLLCFDRAANTYEVAQYTPYAERAWHDWLRRNVGDLAALEARYLSRFESLERAPLPRNESDPAFGRPAAAYLDFVTSLNDWVTAQLDDCRALWHARARRNVPFVLQFSGYLPEKLAKGRAALAALDVFDWMTRADALGLSLYTNCGYPDWGHASDAAMVGFLAVAPLLDKPVLVLESGSECDGAVLRAGELRFISRAARLLAPVTVIYEFLKTSAFESSATAAGKLLGDDWRPRPAAVRAVRRALEAARTPAARPDLVFVLDELPPRSGPEGEAEASLALRHRLLRLALDQPFAFLPPRAVERLPRGARLLAISPTALAELRRRLAPRGVAVEPAADFLAAREGAARPGPR